MRHHLYRLWITLPLAFPGLATSQEGVSPVPGQQETTTSVSRQEAIWRVHDIGEQTGATRSAELFKRLSAVSDEGLEAAFSTFMMAKKAANDTAEMLLKTIQEHADPAFGDGNEVRLDGAHYLMVSATIEHQTWVQSFLATQRRNQDMVDVKGALFRMPIGTLDSLGKFGTSQVLEAAAVETLKRKLMEIKEVEFLSRPRLLLYLGALGTMNSRERTAYIEDYELVVVEPGAREIPVPIIAELDAGLNCRVRAVPLGGSTYALVVDFEHSQIEAMRQFDTTLTGISEHAVTITLPEVVSTRLTSWPALASGQGLLLRSTHEASGREHVVLIQLFAVPIPALREPK